MEKYRKDSKFNYENGQYGDCMEILWKVILFMEILWQNLSRRLQTNCKVCTISFERPEASP